MFTKKSRKCQTHITWLLCDHHDAGWGTLRTMRHYLAIYFDLSTYTSF